MEIHGSITHLLSKNNMLPFSPNRENPGYPYMTANPVFSPHVLDALSHPSKLAHFKFKTIHKRNTSLLVIGDSSGAIAGHKYAGRNDIKEAIQVEARPHYQSVTVDITIGGKVKDFIESIEAYAAQWAEGDIALIRADIVIVWAANDALNPKGPIRPDQLSMDVTGSC